MDKERVTVGQLALMLMLVIAGGKFLGLPGILAGNVGHDSWLVLCVGFVADGICLCFLLWAMRINRSACLPVNLVLDVTLGKVVSKIIMCIFFLVFTSRMIVLLGSCYKMFAVTFDVNTNWVLFALPVAAVSVFALARGFTSIARVSQLLFVPVTLSVLAMVANPLVSSQWTGLLPVAEAGWDNILVTALRQGYWFSDYLFVYFVLDKVRMGKRLFGPVTSVFVAGAVITVLTNIVFVTLYGSFAEHFDPAMSKLGVFSSGAGASGRWDWLTLSLWVTSVLLKITLFFYCAYKSLEKIFGLRHDKINLIAVTVIVLLTMLPMVVSSRTFAESFLAYAVVPFALVQYVLPLLYPLLNKIAVDKTAGGAHERA